MPAVSPDGKTIAFVEDGDVWLTKLDGTNPKKFISGSKSSFPAWSPDGKYIVVSVRLKMNGADKSLLYIGNLATDKGFYLTDNNGEYVESGNRITWLPNVLNTTSSTNNQTVESNKNAPINEQKTTPNLLTTYKPDRTNPDPNFAKANEVYRQVMGDDLDNYNDVAAALTYIVVLNYAYLHQQDGVPTNQVRQVYKQFVEKLSQTDGLKNAYNETKQQLAELAILDGVETFRAINSKDQKKINEVTLRILRKYLGNSADKLKITDNGMEY